MKIIDRLERKKEEKKEVKMSEEEGEVRGYEKVSACSVTFSKATKENEGRVQRQGRMKEED